ncbi:MAG: hypothetical protein IJZ77_04665, partial [Bacilli bacterium]|nr:hypothetical protein [Bacilli bacterium]
LQITLYYYDNGSRRQLGRQIHVVANKQKFRNAGFTEAWLSGLIEDPNLELFDSRKLENYFLSDEVYKTYIENEDYIGVSMDELSLHSDAAPSPRGKGYRLVIEPMVSTMKKGTVYLKTVKEIAEVGITRTGQSGKQALKDLSKLLYLEHADVGVSAGNSSGTSDLNKMKSELNGWGYNIIDITSKIPPTEETIPECKWTTPTNCCHLKNDLTGTELANFLRDHPDCDDGGGRQPTCTSATPTTCNFNLNTSISNACTATSSGGYVKDMDNWGCIYESSAANNTSVKDYFLKHGTTTSACAVYCRDELQYEYPKKGMVALIGNRFSIGSNLNSWSYEVVGGQKKSYTSYFRSC